MLAIISWCDIPGRFICMLRTCPGIGRAAGMMKDICWVKNINENIVCMIYLEE